MNHKDYFSPEKIDNNILWTNYLHEKYVNVSIIDLDGKPHAFEISLKKLEENSNTYHVKTLILCSPFFLCKLPYLHTFKKVYLSFENHTSTIVFQVQ